MTQVRFARFADAIEDRVEFGVASPSVPMLARLAERSTPVTRPGPVELNVSTFPPISPVVQSYFAMLTEPAEPRGDAAPRVSCSGECNPSYNSTVFAFVNKGSLTSGKSSSTYEAALKSLVKSMQTEAAAECHTGAADLCSKACLPSDACKWSCDEWSDSFPDVQGKDGKQAQPLILDATAFGNWNGGSGLWKHYGKKPPESKTGDPHRVKQSKLSLEQTNDKPNRGGWDVYVEVSVVCNCKTEKGHCAEVK